MNKQKINKINRLRNNLSAQQQFMLVRQIAIEDVEGEDLLLELLIERCRSKSFKPSYLDSIIFEILSQSNNLEIKQKLHTHFPHGLINLEVSYLSDEYQPLQNLLRLHNYKEADIFTQNKLCDLAGLNKNSRNWLYFTDIPFLPSEHLQTIDILWRAYSRSKFGFSKQREIWLTSNCNWEKFWHQIGWKNNGIACRYPYEFIWNVNAPNGHLPLFNQLRGVQVLAALFDHVVWTQ